MVKQYVVTYPTTFVSNKETKIFVESVWNLDNVLLLEIVADYTGDVNNVLLLESVCCALLNTSAPHSGRYRRRSNANDQALCKITCVELLPRSSVNQMSTPWRISAYHARHDTVAMGSTNMSVGKINIVPIISATTATHRNI